MHREIYDRVSFDNPGDLTSADTLFVLPSIYLLKAENLEVVKKLKNDIRRPVAHQNFLSQGTVFVIFNSSRFYLLLFRSHYVLNLFI